MVNAAEVNLHSGASMFNYPIELPPGPGGFQPKLSLTYNSGVADEMKNKRSTGSWAGIGWSCHFQRICRNLETDKYHLQFNGFSYKLISADDINYYTEPDQYWKITRSENTWEMWDREGCYYRFGGTTDSEQYVFDTSDYYNPHREYYRWDLSLLRDTNNNQATISYTRDIVDHPVPNWETIRAAYPEYLNYGSVQVQFIAGWDENDPTDGYLRYDNPKTAPYGNTLAPQVMETRRLDAIEVKISGNLIRKYVFAYNTTPRIYSSNYGGIYYSGEHTLTSITRIGADGSSQLPATSFTYENLQTYRYDDDEDEYNGNPGNPASFEWPHLTELASGYGGTIGFSYTQISDNTSTNIWTREVVTGKTVDGGIGPTQTYTYTYDDGPKYHPESDWDAEYRGFGEVTETDAVGNYCKHWFYTTGTVNNKNAEKLTSAEYKTQWYDSTDTLLQEKDFDWSWQPKYKLIVAYFYYTGLYVANGNRIIKYYTTGEYANQWIEAELKGAYDIDLDGNYIYVADGDQIVKYTTNGDYVAQWSEPDLKEAYGVAVSGSYVYVVDGDRIVMYTTSGVYVTQWPAADLKVASDIAVYGSSVYIADGDRIVMYTTSGDYVKQFSAGNLKEAYGVTVSSQPECYVYVADGDRIVRYTTSGDYVDQWSEDNLENAYSVALNIIPFTSVYVAAGERIVSYPISDEWPVSAIPWVVHLDQVETTIDSKTSRTHYKYDRNGNVITTYADGDIATNADDATVHRVFYPNTTTNILSKPTRERVYATITEDVGGDNLKAETLYYYDGNNTSLETPPTKGNLTRLEKKKDSSSSMSTYFTHDSYGNMLTNEDANGNTTTLTYDTIHHTYPQTKTYPISGLSESYTYNAGTKNLLSMTDVNGQTITYEYDTFKRLTKAIKPGDSSASPSIEYQYNNWGTLNQQHIKILTKIADGDYLWQSDYFDGLGKVLQTQARGETGHTIISTTTALNNRGLVDKKYVSQDLDSAQVNGYKAPEAGWKYSTYTYDGLDRVTTQTNADGTSVSHDYSIPWQELVTNERGYKKLYCYDAFERLVEVQELDASDQPYATTNYSYDVRDNLIQVTDERDNTITMTYDWLSRRTAISHPDMGSWSYGYDNNGNLTSQTDAKGQTISLTYDALSRLTGKLYPQDSGMEDVIYTYDSTDGGNYGKGRRTGMVYATANPPPELTVATNAATNVGNDTATLNGYLTGLGTDTSAVVEFEYGTTTSYGNTVTADQSPMSTTGPFSYTLNNLTNGQEYHFRAVATGSQSLDTAYGDDMTFTPTTPDTLKLVPNAAGDATNITYVTGASTHWQACSDDSDNSCVYTPSSSFKLDLYTLENTSQEGTINWVKVWIRVFGGIFGKAKTAIKTDGQVFYGDEYATNFTFVNCSTQYDKNPDTGEDWTWDDLNSLQAGVALIGDPYIASTSCFEVWVEVEYTPASPELTVATNAATNVGNDTATLNGYLTGLGTDTSAVVEFEYGTTTSYGNTVTADQSPMSTTGPFSYSLTGLTNGQEYHFRAVATDSPSSDTAYGDDMTFTSATNSTSYKYDARGRLIQEKRTVDSVNYTTQFAYDGADRVTEITYPTDETVTQEYNSRGLPYSLSGSIVGDLVTSTLYNNLGQVTEINLNNGLRTTFGYWDTGGTYDTTGGYYGRLWEIKTSPQSGGTTIQDIKHTWDAGGNMTEREDVLASETEIFTYDFLDRLTSVSGPYSESYAYDPIGNITSKGGLSYTYGTKPHAVTAVGSTSYAYDANGNMTIRSNQTITWDMENRPVAISDNGTIAQFVYDGDGVRIKKTENGETIFYINQYYEKNLTTGEVTTSYYLGGRLIAQRRGTDLQYIHQDNLTGTSVMSDDSGASLGTIKYFPFGATRSGSVPTDKKFTGQRLDGTGLYYYGARYYDPSTGRFISADPTIPDVFNPRKINPYTYTRNNPLKYCDPSGCDDYGLGGGGDCGPNGCGGGNGYTTSGVATVDDYGLSMLSSCSPGDDSTTGGVGRWADVEAVRNLLGPGTTVYFTDIGDGYPNMVPTFVLPDGTEIGGLKSISELQQTAEQQHWGYRYAGLVKEGPRGEGVPLYIVEPGSRFENFMNKYLRGAWGVSLAPTGIFIRARKPNLALIAHECYHYEEQMHFLGDPSVWYGAYFEEINVRFQANMLNVFQYKFDAGRALHYAYRECSAEVRARAWEGKHTTPYSW